MSWTLYGILFVFGAFVLLMILNPRLSCFGKRIASPFYPLTRNKRVTKVKTEDYGFKLAEGAGPGKTAVSGLKTGEGLTGENGAEKRAKPLKTVDYGFHLGGSEQGSGDEETARRNDQEES